MMIADEIWNRCEGHRKISIIHSVHQIHKVKEVLDTLNSLVACDAAVSTTEEETLITFTGFCWRCHSTEHKESKGPNAKDDK